MAERFVPEPPPREVTPEYLYRELSRLGEVIDVLASGQIPLAYSEPDKPYTGMTRFADGTNWDPGSGRGVYYYDENDTSWHKLG